MKRMIYSNGFVHVDAVLDEKRIERFLRKEHHRLYVKKKNSVPDRCKKTRTIYFNKNGERITGPYAKYMAKKRLVIYLKPSPDIVRRYSEYKAKVSIKIYPA